MNKTGKSHISTKFNFNRYKKKSNIEDYNIDRLKKIRRYLPRTGKLLEIGALDGTTVKFYKEKFNGITYGIDISEDNFRYAKPYFASFLNRIFILFGFQPVGTEVSAINSKYGNKFRRNLIPAGHIRNFTYKALRDILIKNGYKIIGKKSANMSRNKYIQIIENFFGFLSIEFGSDVIF